VNNWVRVENYNQEFCAIDRYGTLATFRSEEERKTCDNPTQYGLHLSVYKNNKTNQYMIVFEGTTSLLSISDVSTNIAQIMDSIDVPEQYTLARDEVERLIRENPSYANAILTGHSLGGGIAQYLAISLGMKAYTFNPAGLSDNTIDDANTFAYNKGLITEKKNVLNIISNNNNSKRDIVSKHGHLIGEQKFMYVKEYNSISLHNIDNLYYAINYHAERYISEEDKVEYIFNYLESKYSSFSPHKKTVSGYSNKQKSQFYYRNYSMSSNYKYLLILWGKVLMFETGKNANEWRDLGTISEYYNSIYSTTPPKK